jgi:hypothetical protein
LNKVARHVVIDVMDTKRNRAASSSGAAARKLMSKKSTGRNSRDSAARAASGADDSARRALESETRVLGAFPWARFLAPTDRARFADELSNHPTEMTNTELEALLVSWRSTADAARRRAAGGDNASRRSGRAA